jgi:hypothetical protein
MQDDFILEDPDFMLECAYTMADELEWPADLDDPSFAIPTSTTPAILTQDINELYTNVGKEKAHPDRGAVPKGRTAARDIDDCLRNEYVFPGCRMSVDEYILQLNGIKLLSRCSWRTLELVISLVQSLLSGMSVNENVPTCLSSLKTYTSRQMQAVDEALDAVEGKDRYEEYLICKKCGKCNDVNTDACTLCNDMLSATSQRYVHFPVRRTIARRLATSQFRESLQEGFAQYQEEIAKGEEGLDAPYRLNYRRLVSEGYVQSWKDIVLNICVDGVTKGNFAGATMSFTPIVAQVASMRYEDRADHNNLIVLGVLQGSASDTKMDGPLEILVEDLLASRSDEHRIYMGLLSADHQCLRKLIKCTGDASVCPCERCSMSGTPMQKGGNQKGRYIYPFSRYAPGQTYKTQDDILAKLDVVIDTRLQNNRRRHDDGVTELLKSFSFYGRTIFLQLPEFNLRHSVPIDVMHLAGNAGEFVRELLKEELSSAGTEFANALLSQNLSPSENFTSGRGFTFGRRWKTADYLHFLCMEMPLIIGDRARLANKSLRIALQCLSAVFRICSVTDAPKAAIVPLDQLCLSFGYHWFNATGDAGAKLWAHRVIHLGHVLRSTCVPSDGWLFIFERFFGKLTKSIAGTVRAFEQVRNTVPLLEHIQILGLARKLSVLAFNENDDYSDEEDRNQRFFSGLGRRSVVSVPQRRTNSTTTFCICPLQNELCEPTLLGSKEVLTLTEENMQEALEFILTVDRDSVDIAVEIVAHHRAHSGKEHRPNLASSRSLGRRLMNALRWINQLPRSAEFEDLRSLCASIVPVQAFLFQRAEIRASRGKLHLATRQWSLKRKACDSAISFLDADEQSLCHATIVDIVLLVRQDRVSFVALRVDTLQRSDRDDISTAGIRLAKSRIPCSRELICVTRVHHKAVIEHTTDTLLDYDRSWFTVKNMVETLLKTLVQKGQVYSYHLHGQQGQHANPATGSNDSADHNSV